MGHFLLVALVLGLLCPAAASAQPAIGTPPGYLEVRDNGTPETRRRRLNLISGSGATVSCLDNGGTGATDCTVSATGATAGISMLQGTPVSPVVPGGVAQTVFVPLSGSDMSPTQLEVRTHIQGITTLNNLRCFVTTAPGVGQTVTITVQTSGGCMTAPADTTLVCTITGTATESSVVVAPQTVASGNCAAVKVGYTAGAATSFPRFVVAGS